MSAVQIEAIEVANAHLSNVGLPTINEMMGKQAKAVQEALSHVANAALIAAAPELLGVAQHALYLIEHGFDISPAGLSDLRAAIAKATGSAA